ncbi:uncharacterized protein METZ01_LOCUS184107, partial [marine metagenome]
MIELIIAIGVLSAVMYLLILLYLAIGIFRTKTELTDKKPFVSIIVSAHNESQNIAICLDSILHQDYPEHKLELIIVNDRSEDDTGMILERYKENYSHIHIININECQEGISPKKNALTQGIGVAKGEIIAMTDADCVPPEQWVKKMVSCFTGEVGIVVGIASLKPNYWWLSPLICIDALMAGLAAYGSIG